MQRLARKAIAEVLNEPEDPASAIVTINPANGDIETMAESESYEKSQYNLAADGHRQPGSTFKAIVLADALCKGVDPNSTIYDSHKLNKGWLPEEPELRSRRLRRRVLNRPEQPRPGDAAPPTTPSTRSWPPTWARNRSPRWPTSWASRRTCSGNPAAGPRRPQARRDAAGNGGRLRDLRRRRRAQQPDRDHQGRLPRRPRRHQLGHPPPRTGPHRTGRRAS